MGRNIGDHALDVAIERRKFFGMSLHIVEDKYWATTMHSLLDSPDDRTDAFPSLSMQTGRVRFGVRGNAVWEWRTENGGYSAEINTQRLKKLQASGLELEETRPVKKLPDTPELSLLEDATAKNSGNPYEHPIEKKSPDPYQARAKPTTPSAESDPRERQRKPIKNLKAYGEWLEMKRRLEESQDD